MTSSTKTLILPTIILIIILHKTSATQNIVSFGAQPDGVTDSSNAFRSAWASACASPARSTILVPSGRFMLRTAVTFSGYNCKSAGITFIIQGSVIAPADFRVLGNRGGTWVSFENVNRVTISGGVFDGQGMGLWACKHSGRGGCPQGVTTMAFTNSMNIIIDGLTSLNSQLYHIVINGCKNVKIHGVKVSALGSSPNTDGIHVQFSTGVTITDTSISTGDDCISIGAGTTNLWMEDIKCGPGHGISIGSLGKELDEAGVQNVTVKTATFTNTENGVRIKSWGRQSNGFVRNVLFEHLTMVNSQNPIIIDQKYCPGHKGCPGQVSGVRVTDVTYRDIHGTSATPIAVNFDCSLAHRCTNIILEDVYLTHVDNRRPASSSCINVDGSTEGVVEPKGCI